MELASRALVILVKAVILHDQHNSRRRYSVPLIGNRMSARTNAYILPCTGLCGWVGFQEGGCHLFCLFPTQKQTTKTKLHKTYSGEFILNPKMYPCLCFVFTFLGLLWLVQQDIYPEKEICGKCASPTRRYVARENNGMYLSKL